MSNTSKSGQNFPSMPVPSQGRRGPVHPDGYQSATRPMPAVQQRYGLGAGYPSQPNPYHQQQNYGYPSSQSMFGGYAAGNGYAAQGVFYGNPVTIRVSNPNWVSELLQAMQQQQEIDLVFDAVDVVNHLVETVRQEVGSFADIATRRIRDAIGLTIAQNAHRGYHQPAAEAMVAPAVVAAIIAAIVVLGLATIYAVITLVGQRNQIDAIRAAAERCRYGVKDVIASNQNQGEGSDSWFSFLNNSTFQLSCNEQ